MNDKLQQELDKSVKDYRLQELKNARERTFANWRKWFIFYQKIEAEIDVNGNSNSVKESIAKNIGVEELRGIFTSGYIFAMIQTKQTFDEMNRYLERTDFTGNHTENYKYFLEIQNEIFKFIDEKIEDSYCLNTEYTISSKHLRFIKDHVVSYKSGPIRHNFNRL